MSIPHVVMRNALSPETIARLFDYAASHRSLARSAEVHDDEGDEVDLSSRNALVISELGALKQELEALVDQWLPDTRAALGVPPFEVSAVDCSLVAYGDGAFYGKHIDTFTGDAAGADAPRQITFVCYFFREPKRFTGGALRLFDLFERESIDVEPENGLVLAFSSWTPHEVMPVSCSSDAFEDGRFAVNIWVHGRRGGAGL